MTTTFAIEHTSALREALAAVAAHADNGTAMIPAISAVKFEARDGQLIVIATDRYTLGVYLVDVGLVNGEHADFEALVSLIDVKRILSTFKAKRLDDPTVWLTMDTESDTLSVFTDVSSLTIKPESSQFPAWRMLVKPAPSNEPATHHGYNARYLARFEKSVRSGDRMVMHPSVGTKPTMITIGDYFVGVICQVKGEDALSLPSWIEAAA